MEAVGNNLLITDSRGNIIEFNKENLEEKNICSIYELNSFGKTKFIFLACSLERLFPSNSYLIFTHENDILSFCYRRKICKIEVVLKNSSKKKMVSNNKSLYDFFFRILLVYTPGSGDIIVMNLVNRKILRKFYMSTKPVCIIFWKKKSYLVMTESEIFLFDLVKIKKIYKEKITFLVKIFLH